MKPNPQEEAQRWNSQAENDLDLARLGLAEGFNAQSCFNAQQSAEKAIKALAYLGGARYVLGHSVRELLGRIVDSYPQFEQYKETASRLDQYYITPRYPNAHPGTELAPFQVFTQGQAEEAVEWVGGIVSEVRRTIKSQ